LLATELTRYQSGAYANQFRQAVDKVRSAEKGVHSGSTALTRTTAQNLYKLMAYKDEYEVARLFTDGTFEQTLKERFDGDFEVRFHLAPP